MGTTMVESSTTAAAKKGTSIGDQRVLYHSPNMSDTTTRGIRVEVESMYVEERSEPRENYYFFAYRVRISNVGAETAQLVSREWIITDSDGNVERVEGPGVVGEQPLLSHGEALEYT